jgi:hypothetical protein
MQRSLRAQDLEGDRLVRIQEASAISGRAVPTLYRMAWARKIRTYKSGGCLLFRVSDLVGLIQERPALR